MRVTLEVYRGSVRLLFKLFECWPKRFSFFSLARIRTVLRENNCQSNSSTDRAVRKSDSDRKRKDMIVVVDVRFPQRRGVDATVSRWSVGSKLAKCCTSRRGVLYSTRLVKPRNVARGMIGPPQSPVQLYARAVCCLLCHAGLLVLRVHVRSSARRPGQQDSPLPVASLYVSH